MSFNRNIFYAGLMVIMRLQREILNLEDESGQPEIVRHGISLRSSEGFIYRSGGSSAAFTL
jgi:hypothetical protein